MYESDNANFDDMGCAWNIGHMIGHVIGTISFKRRMTNRGRKKIAQNGHEKVKIC